MKQAGGDARRDVTAGVGGDLLVALAFVRALARLEISDLEAVGRAWRSAVGDDPPGWFGAEGSVAHAVIVTQREAEQAIVIQAVTEMVCGCGWWRLDRPAGADGYAMTGASVQYAATLSAIALLVRDFVPADYVALLYCPFAALIPVADLLVGVPDRDEGALPVGDGSGEPQ